MSDDLVKRLRDPAFGTETSERLLMVAAADRIQTLTKERDDYAFRLADANNTYSEMHVELEALTEQLEAARADAKEAEAYAEELEAKLAKAVEALREIASEASVTVHTHNKGGINYTRMYEDWRKLAVKRIDKARDTLAEIEGEKT
jgi:chromosome segregation ATPase